MSVFATEFQVSSKADRANFLSQVIAWLRGNESSRVLDGNALHDFDKSFAHIKAENGEELIFRELIRNGSPAAIGFRHDLPDANGRLWRTETVLKYANSTDETNFISFKTQCIAVGPAARTDTPRKPYLIKSIIRDQWPAADGRLVPNDQPIWLGRDADSLAIASSVFECNATISLPVIYVSATSASRWFLDKNGLEKLAYDLGGVAHVVVEPSRGFSFQLRDATKGLNSYGGALAVVVPKYGIMQRIRPIEGMNSENDIQQSLKNGAITIRSRMPSAGWDWLNLQEASLQDFRISERNRLSVHEIESIYQDEISTKNEKIRDLETQLSNRPITSVSESENRIHSILNAEFFRKVGEETYPNEFADRLRLAAMSCVKHADIDGLDARSKAFLNNYIQATKFSEDLKELRRDLKRASRDPKRITTEMTDLLSRHGYSEKSDNKHIRLEPKLAGLESITLSKTPSDHRGLENARKQIEKSLGITKLG